MLKHLALGLTLAAILSCGQNEPLANYEPRSPQEQALKNIMLAFQDGVNTRDSDKIGNLIHEKAAIMTGRDRKILSRAEYIKILPQRLAENPPVSLGKPKMAVSGDKAEVKIYMTRGDYKGLVVFNLTFDNHEWTIQGWKY
ncbi:MAG: hypothetical protein PVI38_18270 [Desulfobacterales bacterium]|jgi:hypothetical protein